jgi:hypothetical protein
MEHLRQLKKRVGTIEQAQKDSDALFQSLRSKWEEIDLSRTLEQQRRRRIIDEQNRFHQDRNVNLISSMYLSHSQNESKIEYDLTSHLRKIRAEKERIKKNRSARLELIEQQQQREKDNAQRRSLEEQNRHNVDERNCVSETQGRINHLRSANKATYNAGLHHICSEVVYDILDMVSLLVEERDDLGLTCLPLTDMWNEWNALFKTNIKLPEHMSSGTVSMLDPFTSRADINLLIGDVVGFRTNTGIWRGTKFFFCFFFFLCVCMCGFVLPCFVFFSVIFLFSFSPCIYSFLSLFSGIKKRCLPSRCRRSCWSLLRLW